MAVHAEEDLLCEVLGQRAIADETQDVVVNGRLVGPDDQAERPFIAALGLLQYTEIWLGERQVAGV